MSLKKHFNKFALLGVTSALALTSVSAMAGEQPTREELLAMLYKQQSQLNELHKMLKHTQAKVDETKKQADEQATSASFLDTVQIGGALEFEATSSEGFDGADTSDLSLAKAELSFSAKPHEYVTTNIVALYEDGSDNIVLDEATIEIANTEEFPLYTQAGKWAVPFGNYDTAMSSDPITKDIGEIKENALLVGATYEGFTAEGFVYNGDTQQAGEGNNIDQYGVNAGYEGEADGIAFAGGVGYINNITDSDGMTDKVSDSGNIDSYTGGLSLHGSVSVSDVTFNAGYVKATDALASGDLAFNGQGAQPEAWNTEISYSTNILGKGTTFAGTYQGSDEALALELPETRYGAAVTVEVYDQTAVTLEYLADEDYSTSEGGTGEDGHTATAKLAVEF